MVYSRTNVNGLVMTRPTLWWRRRCRVWRQAEELENRTHNTLQHKSEKEPSSVSISKLSATAFGSSKSMRKARRSAGGRL